MKKPQSSSPELVQTDRLLTMKEFAEKVGMSLSWLFAQKKAGKLPAAICLGRARRYRESDVEAWLQQHTAAKEAE